MYSLSLVTVSLSSYLRSQTSLIHGADCALSVTRSDRDSNRAYASLAISANSLVCTLAQGQLRPKEFRPLPFHSYYHYKVLPRKVSAVEDALEEVQMSQSTGFAVVAVMKRLPMYFELASPACTCTLLGAVNRGLPLALASCFRIDCNSPCSLAGGPPGVK